MHGANMNFALFVCVLR